MIRSSHLASAAVAVMLTLPVAATAQPAAQAPASAAPSPAAATPEASPAAPGNAVEEHRVEAHIKELHAQLQITAAEEPQWRQFADVMRANAKDMDQVFGKRAEGYATMNALQNMQSYAEVAEAHAQHVEKLVPAFSTLYEAMPEQQKQVADQVFRANAKAHAQKRMQSGRSETR